jgi:hypothetical protein
MGFLRLLTTLSLILISANTNATPQNDSYIAGYAAGVLKQNMKIDMPSLDVRDGIITLPVDGMEASTRIKALQLLSEIPGVTSVQTSEATRQQNVSATSVHLLGDKTVTVTPSNILETGFLPTGHLFKPLLADPRWPHFSVAYRNYQTKNFNGTDIASVSFGETIPIYRANFGHSAAQWEAGIQAGVFSDFNLDAASADLINTDFTVSAYSSIRSGQFSAFGRLYHQSSHLGDEYLLGQLALNSKFQRVNLSYEGVDLKLSYELPYGVRFYGGGGGLIDKTPSVLKIWSVQYGVEFRSPWRIDFASMRPIIAADLKNYQENNWSTDVSARAGVEFENLKVLGRKLQILAEYYNGYTPSGQFYKDKVEYVGVGAHYHF